MIKEYINSIINNKKKLIELKKAIARYKSLGSQFGQKFLDEAIVEVKK